MTAPTVRSAVKNLEKLRILREITGKQRDRVYVYDLYENPGQGNRATPVDKSKDGEWQSNELIYSS